MQERKIIERSSIWVCVNTETGKFVPNQLYHTNKYAYPTRHTASEQFGSILRETKYKLVELKCAGAEGSENEDNLKGIKTALEDKYFEGLPPEAIIELAKKSFRLTKDLNEMRYKTSELETENEKLKETIKAVENNIMQIGQGNLSDYTKECLKSALRHIEEAEGNEK